MGIFGSYLWYCRKLPVAPEYLSQCSIKFYIVVITVSYFPSSSSVLFISVIQSVNGGEFESIIQGHSEGTSSLAFEVLIINCQIYFINLFIFNCLTLNIKLFIFKFLDVKFLFFPNVLSFANRREWLFMELWTCILSFEF